MTDHTSVPEDRKTKLRALRLALEEGEASGLARPFNIEAFLEEQYRIHTQTTAAHELSRP